AEDGIRDWSVTGVQTCALPISGARRRQDGEDGEGRAEAVGERGGGVRARRAGQAQRYPSWPHNAALSRVTSGALRAAPRVMGFRSEERRVGREWRSEQAGSELE